MYDKSPIKNRIVNQPAVKDDCPKCGAGSDEREFTSRDFLGIEAIHMHYLCRKYGKEHKPKRKGCKFYSYSPINTSAFI